MRNHDDTIVTDDNKLQKTGIAVTGSLAALATVGLGLGTDIAFGLPQKAYRKAKQGKWGEAAVPAAWTALSLIPGLGMTGKVAKVPHWASKAWNARRVPKLSKKIEKAQKAGKYNKASRKRDTLSKVQDVVNRSKEYQNLSKGQKARYWGSQAEFPLTGAGIAAETVFGRPGSSTPSKSAYKRNITGNNLDDLPDSVKNIKKNISSNWAASSPKFNKFYSGAKSTL